MTDDQTLVMHHTFDLFALAGERDPMRALAETVRENAEEEANKQGRRLRTGEPLKMRASRAVEAATGQDVFLVETVWATDRR